MAYIYIVKHKLTEKAYVGQTINSIFDRFSDHVRAANKGLQTHFARALRKYGADMFVISVLEECDKSKLNERESHWIKALNTRTNGFNETDGGEGVKGYKHGSVQKRRMRKNHWRKRSDAKEIENRIKHSRKNYKPTKETIEKVAAANRGKKRTIEFRIKRSKDTMGSGNGFFGKKHPKRKPVDQFTIDGQFIATHECVGDAMKSLGVNSASIRQCCKGKCKTSMGFVWKWHSNT